MQATLIKIWFLFFDLVNYTINNLSISVKLYLLLSTIK